MFFLGGVPPVVSRLPSIFIVPKGASVTRSVIEKAYSAQSALHTKKAEEEVGREGVLQ